MSPTRTPARAMSVSVFMVTLVGEDAIEIHVEPRSLRFAELISPSIEAWRIAVSDIFQNIWFITSQRLLVKAVCRAPVHEIRVT